MSQMTQMILYTNPQSRSACVEMLMVELGIDCQRVTLEYNTSMKAADYLAINPFGKVPTLVDGDVIIYELAAICAYLADKYADKGLAPALNDPKRGLYYRWLFFMAGPWEAASTNLTLSVEVSKEQEMSVGYGNYETAYHALILGLEQAAPYLCGEQFTAADIYAGGFILWGLSMGKLAPYPAMLRYAKALQQRPSMTFMADCALEAVNA